MRTRYTLAEYDLENEQATQQLEEIPHTYKRSPKRSAIYLVVCSYITAIFALLAHQVEPATFLPAFFMVAAIMLHMSGWFCLACIEEW